MEILGDRVDCHACHGGHGPMGVMGRFMREVLGGCVCVSEQVTR